MHRDELGASLTLAGQGFDDLGRRDVRNGQAEDDVARRCGLSDEQRVGAGLRGHHLDGRLGLRELVLHLGPEVGVLCDDENLGDFVGRRGGASLGIRPLFLEVERFDHLATHLEHIERLAKASSRARGENALGVGFGVVARDRDDLGVLGRRVLLEPGAHLEPVDTRHHQVEKDQLRTERDHQTSGIERVLGHLDLELMVEFLDHVAHQVEHDRLVVDDEDATDLGARGHVERDVAFATDPLEVFAPHTTVTTHRLERGDQSVFDPTNHGGGRDAADLRNVVRGVGVFDRWSSAGHGSPRSGRLGWVRRCVPAGSR